MRMNGKISTGTICEMNVEHISNFGTEYWSQDSQIWRMFFHRLARCVFAFSIDNFIVNFPNAIVASFGENLRFTEKDNRYNYLLKPLLAVLARVTILVAQ